nr:MAG TPA: replisome organizer [Caudoviricetes sp.]
MTKNEFATLAIAIKSAYPASKILEDTASMDFWYRMLQDVNYKVAENAIAEHICTNVYPPNIAEIRKLCAERTQRPVLPFDEAWGVVQKAMRDYGFYNPQKAFETMDELTLEVVKNLGWSRLCQSENPTANRANFREAYEAKAKAIQNNMQLPEFVAQEKLQIQEHFIPAIETKETPKIEEQPRLEDIREELTEEQQEQRRRLLEKARRRILGGKAE